MINHTTGEALSLREQKQNARTKYEERIIEAAENAYENRRKRRKRRRDNPDRKRQDVIKTMTNWQRSQWGRAGYPQDMKEIKRFAELAR